MAQHPLPTITNKIERFLELDQKDATIIIVCTINAQSLVAHAEDIESDEILMHSDIVAITETWMNETPTVSLNGYELVSSSNNSSAIGGNVSSSATIRRTAGGVAIYRGNTSRFDCHPIHRDVIDGRLLREERVGDICLGRISLNDQSKFDIAAIYIHPAVSKTNIKRFLFQALEEYKEAARRPAASVENDTEIPLIITGDFNTNIDDDAWLIELLRSDFGLTYITSPYPTTLGNTRIDLTFVKNLDTDSMPYVSYFSYHRPLFNKIKLKE